MPAESSSLLVSPFTTPNSENALFIVVFTFVLPVIATIGLVGNILSIIVLNNKDKFKSVIYIYLRGVALCDLTYMLLILNMCAAITISDYRQFKDYYMSWNPPGLEEYIWNYLPPLLNAIGSSSSVIVVFLTLNRHAAQSVALGMKKGALEWHKKDDSLGGWFGYLS